MLYLISCKGISRQISRMKKSVTDVTEFNVKGKKTYLSPLSPILDLYNDEIISFSISRHPNFTQTKDITGKGNCRLYLVVQSQKN